MPAKVEDFTGSSEAYSIKLQKLLIEQRNSTFWLARVGTSYILYDLMYYSDGARPIATITASDAIEVAWQSLATVGDRVCVHQHKGNELDKIILTYDVS